MSGLLLGLDLTEVGRVREVLERFGERFVARVFLPEEIRRQRREAGAFAEHVAGRFAAKEAAMKALGTGFRGVAFKEIAVLREPSGKPRLEFRGRALERARALHVSAAEVSITHTRTMAAAAVVLLTEEGPGSRVEGPE